MVDPPSVAAVEQEMAAYYDAEEGREDRALDPRRIAARDRFIVLVARASVGPVLEVGTGPGRDAVALADAGVEVVGVDLSSGHAARAAARGVPMTVASVRALPFATGSVAALWSMSTLMHVPAIAIEATMQEVARVLAPGAPVAIGVWGGSDVEHFADGPTEPAGGPRRLFSRRSEARWRSLLAIVGRVEHFASWGDAVADDDAFRYHLAFVTAGPP